MLNCNAIARLRRKFIAGLCVITTGQTTKSGFNRGKGKAIPYKPGQALRVPGG